MPTKNQMKRKTCTKKATIFSISALWFFAYDNDDGEIKEMPVFVTKQNWGTTMFQMKWRHRIEKWRFDIVAILSIQKKMAQFGIKIIFFCFFASIWIQYICARKKPSFHSEKNYRKKDPSMFTLAENALRRLHWFLKKFINFVEKWHWLPSKLFCLISNWIHWQQHVRLKLKPAEILHCENKKKLNIFIRQAKSHFSNTLYLNNYEYMLAGLFIRIYIRYQNDQVEIYR